MSHNLRKTIYSVSYPNVSDYDDEYDNINWNQLLESHGFISVDLNSCHYNHWNDVQAWCRAHFNVSQYTCTGYKFWFERQEDATLFALRWA